MPSCQPKASLGLAFLGAVGPGRPSRPGLARIFFCGGGFKSSILCSVFVCIMTDVSRENKACTRDAWSRPGAACREWKEPLHLGLQQPNANPASDVTAIASDLQEGPDQKFTFSRQNDELQCGPSAQPRRISPIWFSRPRLLYTTCSTIGNGITAAEVSS